MDQLKKIFGSLSKQQIIGIVAVVLLIGGGLMGFVKWNHERDFKPLFTGMAAEDAAAIVQKLKEGGVEHRFSDNGGTILVPTSQVDELRLEMAGAGLPKTGRVGFELFDRNNLGITDFTEHVNYRRALEGELERSIRAISTIEEGRVHLTFPKDSVFLDYREPAKASILVRTRAGAHLSPQNVAAIANLVASAVEGLLPGAVSILDMQGNLLNRPRKMTEAEGEMTEAVNYRRQIERDLVSKVESTLNPLLGEGRFRVGVSADTDLTSSEQNEEVFDPTKSVMVTSQKSEDAAGSAQQAGVPGTPSNLPRATPPRIGTGNNSSRRMENTAFETSKLVRHTKVPQGIVKRISASLLFDQEVRWEGSGKNRKRTVVAPTPERIKAINDIVSGVLGIDTARGDRLVIESLPFEDTMVQQSTPETGPATSDKGKLTLDLLMHDKKVLIGAGSGLVVLLAAGFFLLRRKKKVVDSHVSPALPDASTATDATSEIAASEAERAADQLEENSPADQIRRQLQAAEASAAAKLEFESKFALPALTKKMDGLRQFVKDSVKKEPQLAADILRSWLDQSK